MRKCLLLTCLWALTTSALLFADNWPQWRGPSLNGVSGESALPTTWTATQGVAWKLPMPAFSGSTPVIWGDRIFLNVATAARSGDLELWAVDRNSAQVAWKRPIAGGNNFQQKQNMSSPSPVSRTCCGSTR